MTSRPLRYLRQSVCAFALALSWVLPAHADEPTRVVYAGRLEDGKSKPIGGVFPLTFSLYRADKGGRAVWSEAQFVAVDNGVYAVELGRKKALPKDLDASKVWLAVALTGGKELVREPFSAATEAATEPAPVKPAAPPSDPSIGAPPQPAKGTYADTAGFAQEAERAKHADAIGDMTVADLKALAAKVGQGAAAGAAKAKLGATLRYTESAGGTGGQEFTLQCPPGHVATGIRGRGAMMIDQLSVICAPLE
jgi:hypothetical protein